MESLLGWSNMKLNKNIKTNNFDNLFHKVNNVSSIIVAIDSSGSTTFTNSKSYDGMNFSQIYAYALNYLHTEILPSLKMGYDIYGWSNRVKKFTDDEVCKYISCIEIGAAFAEQIVDLNGGTQPSGLIPFMNNAATILVTDGEIEQSEVQKIQTRIKSVSSGPVFLVIIPHIDSYKKMYEKEVEANAIDSINITIPQAFAEKLGTVIIWNHKKKIYEAIKELTAPWLLQTLDFNDLTSLFSGNIPLIKQNDYLIKINDTFKTFSIENLIDFIIHNKTDSIEEIIEKLISYKISESIIQQGNVLDKQKYNAMCMTLFNKGMNDHMNSYVEESLETTDLLELIKQSAKNNNIKKKLEQEYIQKYKAIFNKLMIDKTVGEVNNIAAAKTLQTRDNVKNFQAMAVNDKLAEISQVLPVADCTICSTNTNIFKTINIPNNFFTYVSTCINSREVKAKKNKTRILKTLDITAFKNCLIAHKPTLHCLDICSNCANIAINRAKRLDDPEYGITNVIPQNIVNGVVQNRLMLLPLIDPAQINEYCNPNIPNLSFCRQIMRGFISKYTGLEVAGQDTMIALLMFLTALAHDKDSATLVYASQLSVLRGGANDRFNETVGRLFKPTLTPISSSILAQIMAVENVIELAEMNVLPASRKLLLFCLIERIISPLLHAMNYRNKSTTELINLLSHKNQENDNKLISSYGFTQNELNELIVNLENFDVSKFNDKIAYNIQKKGIQIDKMIHSENNLKNILASTNLNDLADNLDLDQEYFKNIIAKSDISEAEFINVIPKFITSLVNSKGNDDNIASIIIRFTKNFDNIENISSNTNVSADAYKK